MAKRVEQLVKTMLYVAMAALVAMMLIVVANIIGRVAKIPIFGSGELIGMLSVILISFSLSYTAFCQANVVVKFLVSRFSEHGQAIFDVIACLLGIGTIALPSVGRCRPCMEDDVERRNDVFTRSSCMVAEVCVCSRADTCGFDSVTRHC